MRSRSDSKTAASPEPMPAQVTVHKSREPGMHGTAHRKLNRLESILTKWLGCPKPHLGSSGVLLRPGCGECTQSLLCSLVCLGGRGRGWWIWSVSDSSWSFFELFPFCLKALPGSIDCSLVQGRRLQFTDIFTIKLLSKDARKSPCCMTSVFKFS